MNRWFKRAVLAAMAPVLKVYEAFTALRWLE
jgi:hypothetical protein